MRSHDRQNFRQCPSAEDGEEDLPGGKSRRRAQQAVLRKVLQDKNELRSRTGLMETLLREQARLYELKSRETAQLPLCRQTAAWLW